MNLYTCSIDLKDDAKALAFARAIDEWMAHLQSTNSIGNWRLLRRKLNLAADGYRDFLLEIEINDLAQLDQAFRQSGSRDEDIATMYRAVHTLISKSDSALYRTFPDTERSERMSLI